MSTSLTITRAELLRETALFIYLDTETIPSQDPTIRAEIGARHLVSDEIGEIKPAANLTDSAKIAADIEKRRAKAIADLAEAKAKAADKAEDEWRKTALDAAYGQVAVIGWQISGQTASCALHIDAADLSHEAVRESERKILREFFRIVDASARSAGKAPIIVAHHAAFDITFIWQRAAILGVKPPSWWPIHAPNWSERVVDTMALWAGPRDRIKLDKLCRALGMPGKGDVDGSMVWDLVRDGQIDTVADYCLDDVEKVVAIHRRLTFAEQPVERADLYGDRARRLPTDDEVAFDPNAFGDA